LECLVLARRAAQALEGVTQAGPPAGQRYKALAADALAQQPNQPEATTLTLALVCRQRRLALQQLMWQEAGLVRTPAGVRQALAQAKAWLNEAQQAQWARQGGWAGFELVNLNLVAIACLADALERPQACGAHYWAPTVGQLISQTRA
jgi:aspartate oxidase